jgi:hypothetical protein
MLIAAYRKGQLIIGSFLLSQKLKSLEKGTGYNVFEVVRKGVESWLKAK